MLLFLNRSEFRQKWIGTIISLLDCVFLTSLVIGYNFAMIIVWMMTQFFPLFQAKLFTGKLGSHEISNIIPPWM